WCCIPVKSLKRRRRRRREGVAVSNSTYLVLDSDIGFRGRWSLRSHEMGSVSYEPKLPVVSNASGRKKRSKKCGVGWVREEGREDAGINRL
ncbi:unnamed protein product, partial [Musa textilis]